MGKKDLWQSDYFESNRRFADMCNGALFGGKDLIKPEDLKAEDSTIVNHLINNDAVKVICDKVKKWNGIDLAIVIIENQSYVDFRMVLRAMQDEILAYERQRKEAFEKAKKEGYQFQSNELLSGMKREQKFIPVITLILYLGTEDKWDGAKTLYELLEIGEDIKPLVSNYKLNIFDYHEYGDFSIFKTENRLLFEVLSHSRDKNCVIEILQKASEEYEVDRDTASAILGMIGVNVDLDNIKSENNGKDIYDMCKAVEDIKNDARSEGIEQGIKVNISKNIQSLMKNLNFTLEQAMDALDIPEGDRKKFYS